MEPVTLDSSGERFIVSIDKSCMDKEILMQMLERIRLEYLARKVDFDDEIEGLGEEITSDWWKKNKGRFIDESK